MSRKYRIDIVDVFAETKLAGNQLAVVHDAAGLSDVQMQAIALETNFSFPWVSTQAVPTVGCPANGNSQAGVKIRTRALPGSRESTNVVSEKLVSSAMACI